MLQKISAIVLFCFAALLIYFFPLECWGTVLICGTVWLFFFPEKHQQDVYTYKKLKYTALQDSVYAQEVSLFVALSIVNKVWIFPFLFSIYLFFLFIDQTHLFNLHFSWFFLLFDEGLHLFLILMSVFFMSTVPEQIYKKYVVPVHHVGRSISCVVFIGVIGCLSAWIVWQSTVSFGLIAHLISSLTGVCAILLGFLLFGAQEDELAT